jgi:hypothetical protein
LTENVGGKSGPLSWTNDHSAPEVRKTEGLLSVTTVRSADEVEERFIFTNWKQLTLAEFPPYGSEAPREHLDLANERLLGVERNPLAQ